MLENQPLINFKAILWDIYGTLFYSEQKDYPEEIKDKFFKGIKNLYLYLSKKHNLNEPSFDVRDAYKLILELIKEEHNKIKSENKKITKPELIIENLWIKFIKEVYNKCISFKQAGEIAYFFEQQVNKVYMPDEVKYLLFKLKDFNIIQGIASNSQSYTILLLNKFLGISYDRIFDNDLCFFSYKMKIAKPDPLFYKSIVKVLEEKKLEPSEVIFIGNSYENDIVLPSNFGFKTIFIAEDSLKDYSKDKFKKDFKKLREKFSHADYIIYKVDAELLEILNLK